MADMIEAKDAKSQLNCDDATLQGHINSGALRAQRVGGKLMLNGDDVAKLAKEGDDGTIVLTGDSENLSIDLGKVVDDQAATMVNPKVDRKEDSITFGDELEVVSYDDGNTKQLSSTKPTAQAAGLSFTDTNTAVITAVEETQVGATTGVVDTVETTPSQRELDRANRASSDSSRRSVRSSRMRLEERPVHWGWIMVMAATLLIGIVFTAPYYAFAFWARSGTDAAKNTARGVDDGMYANLAGNQWFAGFSVEPHQKKFKMRNGNDAVWRDINVNKNADAAYRETDARWIMSDIVGGSSDEEFAPRAEKNVDRFVYVSYEIDRGVLTNKAGAVVPTTKTKEGDMEKIVPVLESTPK